MAIYKAQTWIKSACLSKAFPNMSLLRDKRSFWGSNFRMITLKSQYPNSRERLSARINRRKKHQLKVEFTLISRANGKVPAQLSAFTMSNSTMACENRKTGESCRVVFSKLATIPSYLQETIRVFEQKTIFGHIQEPFCSFQSSACQTGSEFWLFKKCKDKWWRAGSYPLILLSLFALLSCSNHYLTPAWHLTRGLPQLVYQLVVLFCFAKDVRSNIANILPHVTLYVVQPSSCTWSMQGARLLRATSKLRCQLWQSKAVPHHPANLNSAHTPLRFSNLCLAFYFSTTKQKVYCFESRWGIW